MHSVRQTSLGRHTYTHIHIHVHDKMSYERIVHTYILTSTRTRTQYSQVLRDWGPDPTDRLRASSRGITRRIRGDSPEEARQPANREPQSTKEAQQSTSRRLDADHQDPARSRMNLNEVRVGKHLPLDRSTNGSALGMFHSAHARKGLVRELEKRVGWKVQELDWSNELPQISAPAMTPSIQRVVREETEADAAKRPFYWSHPPEQSLYSRHQPRPGGLGMLKSNKHYRALPYGVGLSPAAKRAYAAAPRTPLIGNSAAQTMRVDPHLDVLAAELSRPPDLAGGHKATRTLTGFY